MSASPGAQKRYDKRAAHEYTAAVTRHDFSVEATSPDPAGNNLVPSAEDKTLIVQNIHITTDAATTVTIEGGDGTTFYLIYKFPLAINGGSNIHDLGFKLLNPNDHVYVTISDNANVPITITADEE